MFRHSLLFCLVAACASGDVDEGDGGTTPTGPHIAITPEMPGTRDDLVATVQNGSTAFSIRWYQDGTRRDEFETGTVPHPATERDDVWRVELVDDDGTVVSMDEVTVVNSPPTAFTAQVNPSAPYGGSILRCGLNAIVIDEDGDPITYATEWTKNGEPFTETTTTDYPNDTVAGTHVARDDVFRCKMTATDGVATTTGESADVTVTCNTGGSQRFDVNGTGVDGTVQTFTLPEGVCSIRIEAAGSRGGAGATQGAVIRGTFPTTPGLVLKLLVGQPPPSGLAGGGGTFVVDVDNNLWIAAGGGGSNNSGPANAAESQGRAVTSGGTFGPTARANNGQGGRIVAGSNASGGGGFNQNGGGIAPGKSFLEGARGGGPAAGETATGGYGGGGARGGLWGEGGGGGYSGGGCGNTYSGGSGTWVGCGGGGSFNGGVEPNDTTGANAGPGYVLITW